MGNSYTKDNSLMSNTNKSKFVTHESLLNELGTLRKKYSKKDSLLEEKDNQDQVQGDEKETAIYDKALNLLEEKAD